QLPYLLNEIDGLRDELGETLAQMEASAISAPHDREVAVLVLFRAKPTSERAKLLRSLLLRAGPDELLVIRDTLAFHPAESSSAELRQVLLDEAAEPGVRLRAACGLSELDSVPAMTWDNLSVPLTQALLAEDRRLLSRWIDLLGPARRALISELGRAC